MNADAPAYPLVEVEGMTGFYRGLTKREEFAKAAMQGLLASQWGGLQTVQTFSERSVELADALLTELAKEKKA